MATEVMATEASGNTKTLGCKARAYQLTLNQVGHYDSLKAEFKKLKTCDYFISCREVAPSTGHEHIHMYVHFDKPYKLSKKIMSHGAHVEVCKGSPKQNIAYIRKDGNILDEWGTEPHQGARTIEELIATPIEQVQPTMLNVWAKAKSMMETTIDIEDWHKDVKVYYIQGPSGVGKTERAKSIVREHKEKYGTKVNIVKHIGEFWNGVSPGMLPKVAIYDDFRDSHMKASEFINFIDYNKNTMNIKGGSALNTYELIIITSVQPITTIYSNMSAEPRQQWMRRVEVIDMFDNSDCIDIDDM